MVGFILPHPNFLPAPLLNKMPPLVVVVVV